MIARPWTLAIALCLIAGSFIFGQTPTPDDARIVALVKKLGHVSFAQRESARKELEAIGVPALESLRRASKTADVETNRRIADLIRLFEERLVTQQILVPKEVHLKLDGATVQQAINELSSVSGYPIQFTGDATKINDKKLTLDTGKTSFWQALDQLREAADLMEKVDLNAANAPNIYKGGKGRIYYPQPKPVAAGPILLTPRGPGKTFVSYSGAVRTALAVYRDEKAKELTLKFLVSVEPKLLNSGIVGRPQLDKLFDQTGHALPISNIEMFIDMGDMQGQPSRLTEIRVKEGPEAAKLLKEVLGKLALQVDLQNEVVAKMANVMNAAGKSVDGPNGGTLKVQSVKKLENGDIEVQVSMDNLTPDPFNGAIVVNGNNVIIRGNVAIRGGIVIGPNGVRMSGTGNQRDLPDLVDAKGQKFKTGSVTADGTNFVNGSISRTATIVYQANPGQAEPRDLVLFGTRTHTIGVPFRFENLHVP